MANPDSISGTKPLVLYIAGSGRSGSTLLERLLGQLEGVQTLGEVHHMWLRAIGKNEQCGCSEIFTNCEFWSQIGQEAFGGWDKVSVDEVEQLKSQVDRQRHQPMTASPWTSKERTRKLLEYTDYYARVYHAVQRTTGARIIVDSGKHPSLALALTHRNDIDLRIVHLVRDSRGVSHSWGKAVHRPEATTDEDAMMQQYSPLVSSALWLSTNLAAEGIRLRGVPRYRMRYEDLVAQPKPTLRKMFQALGIPEDLELPIAADGTIDLRPNHSAAGNPMRFSVGTTTLRPDTAWRTQMGTKDRRLVSVLTASLRYYYGYAGKLGT